ncbi:MAG: hypothetical protein K940chlam5_00572 [Candidatus Anoxychlamydiales bacterium]|nr:hypothetical protein [Candidatus Anoxychlamydiales bacterium]
MSVKPISTVTFKIDQDKTISDVESTFSSDQNLQIANIVKDALTTKASDATTGRYTLKILEDHKIELLYNPLSMTSLQIDLSSRIDATAIEKITTAFKEQLKDEKIKKHCEWIFNKTIEKYLDKNVTKVDMADQTIISKKSENILKNAFKTFLKGLDYVFVQKLIHAKAADIAVLSLFAFTILATALTIFAPHLSILHFANTAASVSHPAFGALNITVGMAIFVQAYKNFMKAKKNENKEEMILAIVSMLFSIAIMTTGGAAIANSSNDILLKSLFTICASFSFGVGIYNTIKTQLFRKKLNDAKNLKEFLKEQLEISNKEYEIIDRKIEALNDEKEIAKLLKNHLSTKEYLEAISKDKKFQKDLLLNLELQALQRRKIANVEKILRSKITKRAIDYVKGVEDKDLLADIKKELNHRNIADALRIVATSLSIGAFGFNTLSKIESLNVQNLIYYSTMMVSKLSGFWQNYVPSWRNVPADDKKELKKRKTILEHMYKGIDPNAIPQAL